MTRAYKNVIFRNKIMYSDDFGLRNPGIQKQNSGKGATSIVEHVIKEYQVLHQEYYESRRSINHSIGRTHSRRTPSGNCKHRFGHHIHHLSAKRGIPLCPKI